MKSVIYEFDPVIYPFKLLVSKDFDSKELGDMFYCINENNNLENAPELYPQFWPYGESEENWYFVNGQIVKYINGKKI